MGCTREGSVRLIERRFPELGKFIQDPGNGRLVGVVVHEQYYPFPLQDHSFQGRPVGEGHRDFGGNVGVFGDACGLDEGDVGGYGLEVAVFEDDGYDVVGVGGDPVVDFCEPDCNRPGVK